MSSSPGSTSKPLSPSTTIIVSGLDPSTTRESLDQFFSFCGKIKSIERLEKSATIIFENHSAAKTSIMLDGGTLDGSIIQVRALDQDLNVELDHKSEKQDHPTSTEFVTPAPPQSVEEGLGISPVSNNDEIKQEDKPRSAIAAEYLAHGYVLGDQAISKAIALDKKHGISAKFINYFNKIQEKATKSVKNPPSSTTTNPTSQNTHGYSKKLQNFKTLSTQQYEKALNSPSGSKVWKFYTNTSKQILDVHSEAKRIAESKLGHPIFSPESQGHHQPQDTPNPPVNSASAN